MSTPPSPRPPVSTCHGFLVGLVSIVRLACYVQSLLYVRRAAQLAKALATQTGGDAQGQRHAREGGRGSSHPWRMPAHRRLPKGDHDLLDAEAGNYVRGCESQVTRCFSEPAGGPSGGTWSAGRAVSSSPLGRLHRHPGSPRPWVQGSPARGWTPPPPAAHSGLLLHGRSLHM